MNAVLRRLIPCLRVSLLAFALAPPAAHAVVLISQPLYMGFGVIYPFMPGQTFTAVGSRIDTIGVELHQMNPGMPGRFVTLSLYEGQGSGGALLASRSLDAAAILGAGANRAFVDFDLGAVAVQSGQSYSFQVTAQDERFGVSYHAAVAMDAYAGGYMFNAIGGPSEGDLTFNVTGVPEPGAAALLLAGGACLAGVQLRARRRQR